MEVSADTISHSMACGSSSDQKSSVSDIISATFPAFDHRGAIVEPFDNEAKRDAEFVEKLNTTLIALMIEFHAWSTARPTREGDRTADALEKEINAVMEAEKEQGMSTAPSLPFADIVEKTRQRLGEFVERIRMALAALTGLTP